MRYIFTSYLCTVKSNFSYPSLVGSPEPLNCRYSSNAYLSWERIKERFRSLSLCSRFPMFRDHTLQQQKTSRLPLARIRGNINSLAKRPGLSPRDLLNFWSCENWKQLELIARSSGDGCLRWPTVAQKGHACKLKLWPRTKILLQMKI